MALQALGWDEKWQSEFERHAAQGYVAGRVLVEHRGLYRIATEDAAELPAEIAGKLRHEAVRRSDFPAVGDFVFLKPPVEDGPAIILGILPRRTAFIRKAAGTANEDQVVAANIDTVFVMSALDGDFNLRRVERYLTLAWESGAKPVIILNKADLSDDVAARAAEIGEIAYGVPVHAISALARDGLNALEAYLGPGQTVSVLGSSGVGKSTLINTLLGQDLQATQAVRADDSRGRHTTTHRQLFVRPQGGMIVDTPGMRELQLWSADQGLEAAFHDIEQLATQCRFRDCQHVNEPGCAVRAAVENGNLDPQRLSSHAKLIRELRYSKARGDKTAMLERKREERIANKAMKPFKER
jgi:ribosome biogenesis GTPase